MGFKVKKQRCETCIYRKDNPLDLTKLEDQVRDKIAGFGFNGYRICHHDEQDEACCRGFWDHHKDEFPVGQVAQRLNAVEFV